MKLHFTILLTCVLLTTSHAQVSVKDDSLFSAAINSYSPFTIILPDGYRKSEKRYRTVYLLHGFNADHTSWVNSTRLVELAASYQLIIVTPNAKNSWYANSVTETELRFEDLLIKDIIPFIDKKYRTVSDRKHRAVAGMSMGGYGAIKYGLKYPEMFFYAAGISPSIQFPAGLEDSAIVARRSAASNASVRAAFGAERNHFWNDNDIFFLVQQFASAKPPYFYLSAGSLDGIPEIIYQTHDLANTFREKKIPFEMHESPGAHDWQFWDAEIEAVLKRISTAPPR